MIKDKRKSVYWEFLSYPYTPKANYLHYILNTYYVTYKQVILKNPIHFLDHVLSLRRCLQFYHRWENSNFIHSFGMTAPRRSFLFYYFHKHVLHSIICLIVLVNTMFQISVSITIVIPWWLPHSDWWLTLVLFTSSEVSNTK